MRALKIAAAVVVLSIVGLFAWAQIGNWQEKSRQAEQAAARAMPIEQKFVTAAAGSLVSLDDPRVVRARALIDSAASSYGIERQLVADQAYTTFKIATNDGISVSAMEVLEAAAASHVPKSGVDFAEACAGYVTLRKSGMLHVDAVKGLRGLLSGFAKSPR